MGRKPKLYVPLTVTFFEDDRIIEAGDGPTLLYIAMCLRCKAMGSDGRLSEAQVSRLHRPRWKTELKRLVELGLVIFDDSSRDWFVAGWFSHNEPIAAVDARRAADRARKALDSARNPDGFHSDSGPKGREVREGKERNPRVLRAVPAPHRFDDDGTGSCLRCELPFGNEVHAVSEPA